MNLTLWQGLSSKLPTAKSAGALYFLTDSQEIYFDADSSSRVRVGLGALTKSLITSALGYTPPEQDTTYPEATLTKGGIMTDAQAVKLAGIETGAQVNTVTGVKGSAETTYRTGQISLTAANVGAAAASHEHDAGDITSGTFDTARIPNLNTSKLTAGTLGVARGGTGASTLGAGVVYHSASGTGALSIATAANLVSAIGTNAVNRATADADGNTISTTYAKKSDISGIYIYKGSVATEASLPSSGQTEGDVYNIEAASSYGAAGMNVAWNGTAWDALGEKFQIETMSADEAKTGTATTAKAITAAVLNAAITNKGYTTNTGTVTSVATGIGLTGGTITGSGTIKVKLKSETAHTASSASLTNTADRQYAVGVDKDGYLSVNVPWENTHTITGVKGNAESTYRTGQVNLTAANIGAAAASHTHDIGDITGTIVAAQVVWNTLS